MKYIKLKVSCYSHEYNAAIKIKKQQMIIQRTDLEKGQRIIKRVNRSKNVMKEA